MNNVRKLIILLLFIIPLSLIVDSLWSYLAPKYFKVVANTKKLVA